MTQARRTLVSVEETPYYHCIGRCVRRAYLCGEDAFSGRSYEHRRAWMRERLALLTQVFAIDLCAYALMSNHYHLILKLCPSQLTDCTDFDLIDRWCRLFSGPVLIHRYRQGEALQEAEMKRVHDTLAEWRGRLADLSWFMRCLNEYIARRANREDGVTGHFWEARFRSQALLDDIALLQGMVYTDLNPIRAAMATGIADSAYTSAQQRFLELMGATPEGEDPAALPELAIFRPVEGEADEQALPFTLDAYLELVDGTGRCCVQGKRGFIGERVPRLLTMLGIDDGHWLGGMQNNKASSGLAIGSPNRLRQFAERMHQRWMQGLSWSAALYPS